MTRTRRTWNSKSMAVAGVLLAAVIALTAYVALSGSDSGSDAANKSGASESSSTSAAPTYQAPDDWTEPERWVALPRGTKTDAHGSQVGYPHSTEGAVAMMTAANTSSVEGETSTVDEQLRIFNSYIDKADQTPSNAEQIELQAQQTDKSLAKQMGVKAGQPLPSGAYIRNAVVGYKVIKESSGEVSVWLLAHVTQKDGETAKERSSYTRTLNAATWENGDWKLSGQATQRATQEARKESAPTMVAPGDAAFNDAGWTAIREAS